MPVLESLLEESARGIIKLYTSEISRVEVAFAASEQKRRVLDPAMEARIDSLWDDQDAITMVEYHSGIAVEARNLMRDAITRDWSLKPLDAIHLATTQWLSKAGYAIAEFHTYDTRLFRYGPIVGFRVIEPITRNPKLL